MIGIICFDFFRNHQICIDNFFKNFWPLIFLLPARNFLNIFAKFSDGRQLIGMQIKPILYWGSICKYLFSSEHSFQNVSCQIFLSFKVVSHLMLNIFLLFFLISLIQPCWVYFIFIRRNDARQKLKTRKTFVALEFVKKYAISKLFV